MVRPATTLKVFLLLGLLGYIYSVCVSPTINFSGNGHLVLDAGLDFPRFQPGSQVVPTNFAPGNFFTFSGWINPTLSQGSIVSWNSDKGNKFTFALVLKNSNLVFLSRFKPISPCLLQTNIQTNITLDQWSHVAVTVSLAPVTRIHLYVNRKLEDSYDTLDLPAHCRVLKWDTPTPDEDPIHFGRYVDDNEGEKFFTGQMSDVIIRATSMWDPNDPDFFKNTASLPASAFSNLGAIGEYKLDEPASAPAYRFDGAVGPRFTCLCGNGKLDVGEECDGGVGCQNCECPFGYVPTSPVSKRCEAVTYQYLEPVQDIGIDKCGVPIGATGDNLLRTAVGKPECGWSILEYDVSGISGNLRSGVRSMYIDLQLQGVDPDVTSYSSLSYPTRISLDPGYNVLWDYRTAGASVAESLGLSPFKSGVITKSVGYFSWDESRIESGARQVSAQIVVGGVGGIDLVTKPKFNLLVSSVYGGGFSDPNAPAKNILKIFGKGNGATNSPRLRVALPVCGDRYLAAGEQCDGGVGCLADCTCGKNYVPSGTIDCQIVSTCGNGIIDSGTKEECDSGEGCLSNCVCSPKYIRKAGECKRYVQSASPTPACILSDVGAQCNEEMAALTELRDLNTEVFEGLAGWADIDPTRPCNAATPPKGVKCSSKSLKVLEIKLPNMGITALPADFFENFPSVTILDLSGNKISGSIPSGIVKLGRDLESINTISLSNNLLTGTIPSNIGELVASRLDFSRNQLTGSIPESIGDIHPLWYLNLGTNQLSGTIPQSIGNLRSLAQLLLQGNGLSGTLPDILSNLGALHTLDISNNQFSGTIPELSSAPQLSELNIVNNRFTGHFPKFLTTYVEKATLEGNSFRCPVPDCQNNLECVLSIAASSLTCNCPCKAPWEACLPWENECGCIPSRYGKGCSKECPGTSPIYKANSTILIEGYKTCSGNGVCKSGPEGSGTCTCEPGFATADCSVKCGACNFANADGCNDGSFGDGRCRCKPTWWGDMCENKCPGIIEGTNQSCWGHGNCRSIDGGCDCAPGWSGAECTIACPGGEENPCNKNGRCIEGRCECNWGFAGSDCSEPAGVLAPGEIALTTILVILGVVIIVVAVIVIIARRRNALRVNMDWRKLKEGGSSQPGSTAIEMESTRSVDQHSRKKRTVSVPTDSDDSDSDSDHKPSKTNQHLKSSSFEFDDVPPTVASKKSARKMEPPRPRKTKSSGLAPPPPPPEEEPSPGKKRFVKKKSELPPPPPPEEDEPHMRKKASKPQMRAKKLRSGETPPPPPPED